MAILRQASSVIPFVFCTLAFAFIITSFLSRDWAHQYSYAAGKGPAQWNQIDFTLYRSPFVVCNASTVVTNEDTGDINSTVSCFRFKVYGRGRTSCETDASLYAEFNSTNFTTRGDPRQCEQIHYAGNLMLSSLVFVSLAFALSLPLTAYAILSAFKSKGAVQETNAAETQQHSHHHHHNHEKPIQTGRRYPIWVSVATYSFIIALSVSAVTTFLAQFYAILGLIQSNPDNGLFASRLNGSPVTDGDVTHGPWSQGKGLSVYASLGWFFNALAAGAAGAVWAVFMRS